MNIKWDADKYTRDFSFVHQYGNDVIGLMDVQKNMTILDLGCGNGSLTERLSKVCMKVIGLDASADLLQVARRNYPNLKFIQSDATNFKLDQQVDAVFSNAVFHWIEKAKQPAMLHSVFKALNSGGQFVFEFGGYGNNHLIHSALEKVFARYGLVYKMPFYFPTIGEYSSLLEQAGFKVVFMALFDRMTELKGNDGLADWIRLFIKQPFEELAEKKKFEIIEQTTRLLKDELYHNAFWHADYVRLRGKAFKDK